MLSKHLCLLPIGVLSMLAKSANAIENNNFQPQELVSKNGKLDVTLTVDLVSSLNGKRLAPGYNGEPMGPTLRVQPGDTLTVNLINNLDPSSDYDRDLLDYVQDPNSDAANATVIYNRLTANGNIYAPDYGFWGMNYMNLHFHGAMFNPLLENTLDVVDGGKSKTYTFVIPDDQPPGLHWYHNHVHGTAQYSVMSGLYGFLVIEGTEEDLTAVPDVADATEVFMMLGEADINPDTKGPNPLIPIVMAFDWFHTTNGYDGEETTFTFSKGETVLFRTASASVEPAMYLSINEHTLYPLAYDGYVHPTASSLGETGGVETVTVDAGSRLEFMTTFDKPGTYKLHRAPWNMGVTGTDACTAAFNIPAEKCVSYDVDRVVATIVVTDPNVDTSDIEDLNNNNDVDVAQKRAISLPPPSLPPYHSYLNKMALEESVRTRTVTMDITQEYPFFQLPYDASLPMKGVPVGFGMNGKVGHPLFVMEEPKITLGTCETWIVKSNDPHIGHSFHVHSTPFLVKNVDGIDVPTPYWRDTMGVYHNMTIHVCFPRHTGYLLVHCHMPSHQDVGMLAYYEVEKDPNSPVSNDDMQDTSPSDSSSESSEDTSSASTHTRASNMIGIVMVVSSLLVLFV